MESTSNRMDLDLKLSSPLDSLIRKNRDGRDSKRDGHREHRVERREKRETGGLEACRDFLRGECTRGASCPYSHDKSVPKEPCRDFARGACTRGKECPYSHKVPGDICRDYLLRDNCARGSSCPYKHPKKRLEGGSGSSSGGSESVSLSGAPENDWNEKVCRDYLRGECTRGMSCPYLHSDNVVPVCRDFTRGICTRGDVCPNIIIVLKEGRYHHLPNFRATGVDTCRDFQRGGCSRGASCPYLHIPEYVEICRDHQRGTCKRGLVCPFHHSIAVAISSPSTKRRRDDDSHGERRVSYGRPRDELETLREENRRLRARLAGH